MIVTGQGAAVGLNGGFVHTVQLGANCLPGTERSEEHTSELQSH